MAQEKDVKTTKLLNDLSEISFLEIGAVMLGVWLAIVIVRRVLPYIAERGPRQLRLYLLGSVPIIRLILMVGAVLWIIPIVFNVTFQNFLLIAGAASVAIGFAFKDYVTSLVAGVVVVFEKPYRPGDWVEIEGDYGEVRSVGLRSIRLATPDDDLITVPHSQIWDKNISNSNDGANTLLCVAHFYLSPDHDADRMRAALHDVAVTSAYLDYERPVIVVLAETPHGTHYRLKAYPFDLRDQFSFISDLTARGKRAIAGAGGVEIVMPYPTGPGT